MGTLRGALILIGGLTVCGLGDQSASAQAYYSGYYNVPSYGSTYAPSPRYATPSYGSYSYPYGGWYTAQPATTYRNYYYAPQSYYGGGFGYYRGMVDSGRDPNWAARRGVRLYKPWLY